MPPDWFCDRRQADIFPQVSGQFGRHARPVPPGAECCGQNWHKTALVHGVSDREFKTQHYAALGEHM